MEEFGTSEMQVVASLDKTQVKLETILNSRLLSGFLREYAASQHCTENIAFVHDELVFRENYDVYKRTHVLDQEVRKIYNNFLAPERQDNMEVTVTSDESTDIQRRIQQQDYVQDMFLPLTADSKLNVERDLFPRFRNSLFFQEMVARLGNPIKPYLRDIPVVCHSLVDDEKFREALLAGELNGREFTFEEIISDCHMAQVLRAHLEERRCAENINCILAIKQYHARHGATDVSQSETQDRALAIYFKYLDTGAAEEVSVQGTVRNAIAGSLAKQLPPRELFDYLEAALRTQVRLQDFIHFQKSNAYHTLLPTLRQAAEESAAGPDSSRACSVQ